MIRPDMSKRDTQNALEVTGTALPHEPAVTRKRVASALVWSAAQKWGSRFAGLLVFVLLGRLLGPEDFGVAAVATVVISFTVILVEQGLGAVLVRLPDITHRLLNTAFWLSLSGGLITAGALLVAAPLLASLLASPQSAGLIRLLSVSLVLGAAACVPAALLRRDLRFKPLATRSLVASLVSGCVAVTAAVLGAGAWALAVQQVAFTLTAQVLLWRATTWRPGLDVDRSDARVLWASGLRISATDLFSQVGRKSDDVVVGVLLGPVSLGIYVVAYRTMAVLLDVLGAAVGSVALSMLSRTTVRSERQLDLYLRAFRLCAFAFTPVFVVVGLTADNLFLAVFGDQWIEAVPAVRALALLGVLISYSYVDRALMVACGREKEELRLALVGLPVMVVAYMVGATWGIAGVATAALVASLLVLQPLRLVVLKRCANVPVARRLLAELPSTAGAAALAAVYLLLAGQLGAGDLRALWSLAPAGLVYVLVVEACHRGTLSEVRQLASSTRRA